MTKEPYLILFCLVIFIFISWYMIDYIVLNKKTATINSRNNISNGLLFFYLVGGFILLIYMCLKGFNENLNSIGVIVASQIAGIAIYKNIIHSEQVKEKENKNEEKTNNKILNSYYIHIKELALTHQKFLDELEANIKNNPHASLKQLMINEFYYSDEINNGIYIKPLENMLTHSLHKYTDGNEIVFILEIKEKVLNLMHNSKIARNTYIESNDKKNYLKFLQLIKDDNIEILEKVKTRL